MHIEKDKYMWWCGTSDERFDTQHATREDAIAHGRDEYEGCEEGFHICEAVTPSIKVSNYLDFELLLEQANEQCFDNHGDPDGDGDMISATKEQENALEKAIRECVDKWQSENEITVSAYQFSKSRNEEYISIT
jgi:hypothetical protein